MRVAHVERESDKHGVGHLGSEFLIFPGFGRFPGFSVEFRSIFLVFVVFVDFSRHLSRVGLLTCRLSPSVLVGPLPVQAVPIPGIRFRSGSSVITGLVTTHMPEYRLMSLVYWSPITHPSGSGIPSNHQSVYTERIHERRAWD
jgi:hypothetical protein